MCACCPRRRASEFNIGELARRAWGDDAVLIGMGTDRGEVVAADAWDAPAQRMSVLPSHADSWEQVFLRAGDPFALADWRHRNAPLRGPLSASKLERAIGVVYRPGSERRSHYFSARLAEQFDAWVWIEKTSGVRPLDTDRGTPGVGHGDEEPYPFGL